MKKRNNILFSVLLLSFAISPLYGARHNPFARPAFLSGKKADSKTAEKKDSKTSLANLSLTGIINGKIAIINHQFYRKGQKIGILTIQNITDNKVVLESRGIRYDLILNISKIKKKE